MSEEPELCEGCGRTFDKCVCWPGPEGVQILGIVVAILVVVAAVVVWIWIQ